MDNSYVGHIHIISYRHTFIHEHRRPVALSIVPTQWRARMSISSLGVPRSMHTWKRVHPVDYVYLLAADCQARQAAPILGIVMWTSFMPARSLVEFENSTKIGMRDFNKNQQNGF